VTLSIYLSLSLLFSPILRVFRKRERGFSFLISDIHPAHTHLKSLTRERSCRPMLSSSSFYKLTLQPFLNSTTSTTTTLFFIPFLSFSTSSNQSNISYLMLCYTLISTVIIFLLLIFSFHYH
jgi:hypothetical protein